MTEFASCCVLSYNRPHFLRDCLSSLLANAEYPLELIVHDDGSSDEHLKKYLRALVDDGVISTLIENPPGHNQGQGIALNRMFHMAKGDPIVKIDHDLIFQEGWLRRSVELLNGSQSFRDTQARPVKPPPVGALGLFRYPAPPVRYEDMFIKDWIGGGVEWEQHEDFVGSAMVIPRYVWERFGPFDERSEAFAEDYMFKMKLKENGYALALPKGAEFASNQGFGAGPSTVVAVKEDGSLTSSAIKLTPYLHDARGMRRIGIEPGDGS